MKQKNIKDFLSADKKDIKYSWFLGEFLLSFFVVDLLFMFLKIY